MREVQAERGAIFLRKIGVGALPPRALRAPPGYFEPKEVEVKISFTLIRFVLVTAQAGTPMAVPEEAPSPIWVTGLSDGEIWGDADWNGAKADQTV